MRFMEEIESFLNAPPPEAGPVYNERSLQLEIGCYLRRKGYQVQFERTFKAERPSGSSKTPKTNLDLFIASQGEVAGIELKVPLNKRHPETLFDYCADLEFVEALMRAGQVQFGLCLMVTNDRVFWEDSGRGSTIHNFFRREGEVLSGKILKPTGARDTCVVLTGRYTPARHWKPMRGSRLMDSAQYLLIEVHT